MIETERSYELFLSNYNIFLTPIFCFQFKTWKKIEGVSMAKKTRHLKYISIKNILNRLVIFYIKSWTVTHHFLPFSLNHPPSPLQLNTHILISPNTHKSLSVCENLSENFLSLVEAVRSFFRRRRHHYLWRLIMPQKCK